MTPTPCEQIVQGMGELFECSQIDGYTRIRTPYLYPDGDVTDLYLAEDGGTSTLTDLGETLRWLRSETVSDRKTARQRRLIEEVCLTHGVELYKGMLVVRAWGEEDLGSAVTWLSQAALWAWPTTGPPSGVTVPRPYLMMWKSSSWRGGSGSTLVRS